MKNTRTLLTKDAHIGIINRGEAAVRFIRAVRELNTLEEANLSTVAFYLPIEQDALFVKEADFAYPLARMEGFEDLTTNAYLNHEFMLKAIAHAKCSAIWVGWGFLAEDAVFAKKIEEASLVFIGPSAKAMELLGDKIAAKTLAEKAEVPILPWCGKPLESLEDAENWAKKIGYPVILKAANTGGGRGIRMVKKPEELAAQFKSAREETLRIAGNDILFMEALVEQGRHLEVQMVADYHGCVQTFGVRDCSVQRRNQKIIEETPPANLDPKIIEKMEAASKRLALAAKYENAGTVEFIYDLRREEPYFMEVNTRLQVEHPITEQLYNVDLVKMQLQVAMGQKIAGDFAPRGAAIEVRLNAEDPEQDFTPAPGQVSYYTPPCGPGIRVDSGIEEGSVIPNDFDSMVAKIITFAASRKEAIARQKRALRDIRIKIDGGTTNRAFLLELLSHPQVVSGKVHTRFVEELLAKETEIIHKPHWDIALVACAIYQYTRRYIDK